MFSEHKNNNNSNINNNKNDNNEQLSNLNNHDNVNKNSNLHVVVVGNQTMSPKDCGSVMFRSSSSRPAQNIVRKEIRTTTTTATAITNVFPRMTSNAVTMEELPICVSARCYLIGKMIDDANRALKNAEAAERQRQQQQRVTNTNANTNTSRRMFAKLPKASSGNGGDNCDKDYEGGNVDDGKGHGGGGVGADTNSESRNNKDRLICDYRMNTINLSLTSVNDRATKAATATKENHDKEYNLITTMTSAKTATTTTTAITATTINSTTMLKMNSITATPAATVTPTAMTMTTKISSAQTSALFEKGSLLLQQKKTNEINKLFARRAQAHSEPLENKCSLQELPIFSCQKEVEPKRASPNNRIDTIADETKLASRYRINEDTAPVEGSKTQHQQHKRLRYAERNNRLKLDFFEKNIYELKSQSASTLPKQTSIDISSETKESSPGTSLVAQRTYELNLKFTKPQQKQSHHSTAEEDRATGFGAPSVRQLILKFDKQAAKMMLDSRNGVIPGTGGPQMPVPITTSTATPNESNLMPPKPNINEHSNSPLSDEGCNLGQSPYSSDEDNDINHDNDNDNVSICTASTTIERKRKDKVARSASSDSALGLDVDESLMDTNPGMEITTYQTQQQHQQQHHQQQRRMTLTVTDIPLRPALLPLAEPTALPDSQPAGELNLSTIIAQSAIPSKVLLEERVVEIHEDIPAGARYPESLPSSRRESAQSCFSDYPFSESGGGGGVRFVRTPSVVVSDYSDDVMCGITLEEIEYFRAQRMRRRSSLDTTGSLMEKDGLDGSGGGGIIGAGCGSGGGGSHSDVSASSSCSNLYYCGSTISALDGSECFVNGTRIPLNAERKNSACSTCSATSCGEDEEHMVTRFNITEKSEGSEELYKDLADLLATQHLSTAATKRQKKVGI